MGLGVPFGQLPSLGAAILVSGKGGPCHPLAPPIWSRGPVAFKPGSWCSGVSASSREVLSGDHEFVFVWWLKRMTLEAPAVVQGPWLPQEGT